MSSRPRVESLAVLRSRLFQRLLLLQLLLRLVQSVDAEGVPEVLLGGFVSDIVAVLVSLKCCFPGCFQNPEFLLPRGFLLLSLCQLLGRTECLDISAVCSRSHNWPWGRSRSRGWGSGRCSLRDNDSLLEDGSPAIDHLDVLVVEDGLPVVGRVGSPEVGKPWLWLSWLSSWLRLCWLSSWLILSWLSS